uniref:Uncharacterized protein n=1 Tax=Schistosoma mansoni TaxID=6183 RepID=A0A5K4F3U8_SCHMA
MFKSQVTIVQFLFVFLIWNADDQKVTAQSLESTSEDIRVIRLSVHVKEWDKLILNFTEEKSLNVLDKYCANVLNVVKELEPKLKSVTLSCDIRTSQNPKNIDEETIDVQLAMFSSEMEEVYSSDKWFSTLKDTLESGSLDEDSTWITDIVLVSDPKEIKDEYYLFEEYFNVYANDDKCSELKNIMSRRYAGLGELMENCFFNVSTKSISMKMKYGELMKNGYCCIEYNVYRRIYWSIWDLFHNEKKGENASAKTEVTQPVKTSVKNEKSVDGNANAKTKITQPVTTSVKDESSLGLPSIIRISELENLKVNYTGHCIHASFSSDWSDEE